LSLLGPIVATVADGRDRKKKTSNN
jgi:hypothetical protein